MNMNFTNLNTQYSPEIISAIASENRNSSKSNVSSVYNSNSMNLDAAVLSISSQGTAKINAMMSKSIQLRASAFNPELSAADRHAVNNELRELRREMDSLKNKEATKAPAIATSVKRPTTDTVPEVADEDVVNIEENIENILKNAEESIVAQQANRDHVLQLL